jgi:hypothetical protein
VEKHGEIVLEEKYVSQSNANEVITNMEKLHIVGMMHFWKHYANL